MISPKHVILDHQKRCEVVFVYYLAPVILGGKPASLFAFEENQVEVFLQYCTFLDIKTYCLSEQGRKKYYLFYKESGMRELLQHVGLQEFLEGYGYESDKRTRKQDGLLFYLEILGKRLSGFHNEKEPFPHEIGVFLGYPLDDVKAYIKEQGRNALLSGYWKVYHNPEVAKNQFATYDDARKTLLDFVTTHSLLSYER